MIGGDGNLQEGTPGGLPPAPQPENAEQLEEFEEPLSPPSDSTSEEKQNLQRQGTEDLPSPSDEAPLMENPPESGPPLDQQQNPPVGDEPFLEDIPPSGILRTSSRNKSR